MNIPKSTCVTLINRQEIWRFYQTSLLESGLSDRALLSQSTNALSNSQTDKIAKIYFFSAISP
jgi:hypothetical protein